MEQKEALKPLDSQSKVPSYQDKDTSILPLPTFITREIYESPSNTKPLGTSEPSPSPAAKSAIYSK